MFANDSWEEGFGGVGESFRVNGARVIGGFEMCGKHSGRMMPGLRKFRV